MTRQSSLFASLLALLIAAPLVAAGCAAPTDAEDGSDDEVSETEAELSAAGKQLAGSYFTHSVITGGFVQLELKANGRFVAKSDPAGAIMCVTSPCYLPESGTWSASAKAGGGYRLGIRPTGASTRWYDAVKSTVRGSGVLKLTRAGVTQTLHKLGGNQCFDDDGCDANEECQPRMCLMFCAFGDPFCCGPSTCVAKPPPAVKCGKNTCATGDVCCNPLAGICTPPGGMCAF